MNWTQVKKLAVVLATSMLVTASLEAPLQCVLYICYPVQFQGKKIRVLIDSNSKVNTMTLTHAAKLGLIPRSTNIGVEKIDGLALKTYKMTTIGFWVIDKLGQIRFFEETFLLADISIKVVLEMLFLYLSNTNVYFDKKELTWRTYTVAETIPTSRRVELIDKYYFIKAALDENSETFVVHVVALEASESARMAIHLSRLGQVSNKAVQLAALQ